MLLTVCGCSLSGVSAYSPEAKVTPFSPGYDPDPVDLSPQRPSQWGTVHLIYVAPLMTVPGWSGEMVRRLEPGEVLQARKETDFWLLVETRTGETGWIAKRWLQQPGE